MPARIACIGAGGVASAASILAARRDFFTSLVICDWDYSRAEALVARLGDPRFTARQLDASDEAAVLKMLDDTDAEYVLNLLDPRFVMPVFRAALAHGANYIDTAMSLSAPNDVAPYERVGRMLGDEQLALADAWVQQFLSPS